MTVVTPFGRALSQHLLPRSHSILTRLGASTSVLRIPCTSNTLPTIKTETKPGSFSVASVRAYATETTGTTAGRPKAHTGKSAAKKTASKPKSRTTRAKKATKTKKKAVRKVKAKAKPKPKPKPKRKAPSVTALKQKAVTERKNLKASALLDEPKRLPETAWLVYFIENATGKGSKFTDTAQRTRTTASNYKSLSPLERERLNHTANENKATNEKNYKQWVSKFTPLQIKEANAARKTLSVQKKAASKSGKAYVPQIKDTRLVKQPRNPYSFFNSDRYDSGDFKHMSIKEAAGLIGKEWKALSNSAKESYQNQSQQDRARYIQEYKSVYGVDAKVVSKPTKTAGL